MRKRVSQPDVSQPVPGRPRPLGYGSGLAPGVTPANSNTRISAAALPRQPQAPVPSSGGNLGLNSDRLRQAMVQRLRAQGISDERVLNAMAAVPRHLFVDEALASRAYEESALPIGHSQTISQPWVVARMISAVCEDRAPTECSKWGRLRLSGRGAGPDRARGSQHRTHPRFVRIGAQSPARAAPDDPHPPDLWRRHRGPARRVAVRCYCCGCRWQPSRRRCCSSSRREDG